MSEGRPDRVSAGPQPEQRRIRRNPWLFTAPLVLLCALGAILVWEVVRSNLPEATRARWPWRLELMSQEPLASLLAIAAGAVLARAQYARTVRPVLGWRSSFAEGELTAGQRCWRVGLFNGGQHNVVLTRVDYRLVAAADPEGAAGPEGEWSDLAGVAARLAALDLRAGVDIRIASFGGGFPLVATGTYETIEIGVFSRRFVDEVRSFQVRVRMEDSVGDSHERVIDCLRGVRETLAAPAGWSTSVPSVPYAPSTPPAPRASQEPPQGV
ncbi:hypothetical protein ABZ924_36430 [Streptomyces sp. NPDC046876]|uniref:hypothetical protein n=1 Tax=Streptomyces sp. NPDC046876 TaxID=3155616 RepID=UPI0033C82185